MRVIVIKKGLLKTMLVIMKTNVNDQNDDNNNSDNDDCK